MNLGERIKEIRLKKGLSQMDVARRTQHLSLQAIGEIERGRVRDPRLSTLVAIAHALDTTVADLVGEQ